MKALSNQARHRRRVAIDAALLFIVVLLMVQMWLLTATLESYLAGNRSVALPGVLISGALFLLSLAIYRFVTHLDRAPEPEDKPQDLGPWQIY